MRNARVKFIQNLPFIQTSEANSIKKQFNPMLKYRMYTAVSYSLCERFDCDWETCYCLLSNFQINKLQDFEFSYCPHFASHIRVLQTFYVSYFVGSSPSSFLEMWSCSTCSIEHCAAKKTNFEGTEILFQLFRSKLSIEYKIERSLVR